MRVLLIDDEEDIRTIAKLSLEAVGGHQALLAASGQEGLTRAKADRPELILLDMMMPGMDGLAVLAELRRTPELAAVPIIFMTAKVQQSELDRFIAMGAAGVIQKPFDPLTLASDIERILRVHG